MRAQQSLLALPGEAQGRERLSIAMLMIAHAAAIVREAEIAVPGDGAISDCFRGCSLTLKRAAPVPVQAEPLHGPTVLFPPILLRSALCFLIKLSASA